MENGFSNADLLEPVGVNEGLKDFSFDLAFGDRYLYYQKGNNLFDLIHNNVKVNLKEGEVFSPNLFFNEKNKINGRTLVICNFLKQVLKDYKIEPVCGPLRGVLCSQDLKRKAGDEEIKNSKVIKPFSVCDLWKIAYLIKRQINGEIGELATELNSANLFYLTMEKINIVLVLQVFFFPKEEKWYNELWNPGGFGGYPPNFRVFSS